MKKYNGEKYIVSFTSFGQRFEDACKMIYSLQKQTYKNFHLCITIWEGDLKDITPTLELFIDNDLLEVIVAPENLCPHLKYFYAMKKYWDKPIITVDDDRIYNPNMLEGLVKKYESLDYKSIISNCAPVMSKSGNRIDPRTKWCCPNRRLLPNERSFIAMAEGFAGVLYPPKCFKNLDDEIPDIKKCLYDDDLYLKVLAIKNAVPVTQSEYNSRNSGNSVNSIDIPTAQKFNLEKRSNAPMKYRSMVTEVYGSQLLKGFDL